ncbi:MAG: ATP-binding cassette domain-containing protein [Deltaproteobacteria bacterium]|nr:ATP-binding cassette domain-containing protein [Deltaproteobacteria bacterium]
MTESGPALRFEGVGFASPEGQAILQGIDWELARGEAGSIIGPSGSGKSTLMRLCNGLDSASKGSVSVLGRDVEEWTPRELRCSAVWVPQSPASPNTTARAYLAVPVRLGVISQNQQEQRLGPALEVAHLPAELVDRDVTRLSGGEKQRLALARALLLEPEVLLLDEPTSSLDGESARLVLDALGQWCSDSKRTVVVVTHRLGDVRRLGGQLLMLDGGRVTHRGATDEILAGEEGDDIRRVLAGEERE